MRHVTISKCYSATFQFASASTGWICAHGTEQAMLVKATYPAPRCHLDGGSVSLLVVGLLLSHE